MSRERLEEEIGALNREKADVIEQLNIIARQKASLAEELIGARKEIERQSDTIVRIVKEKEELNKVLNLF
jgi:chromosome segregation ATPase